MHLLIIQTGKHKGKKLKLAEAQVVVGRDEDCRIKIASSDVSRQHALLIPVEDGVLVRDLGSRNGTFVDGVPIQGEVLLRPGGTLSVGPLTFELSGGDGRKAPMGARPAAKKANDPKLSDDDIASWLAEEGALLSSDTTIVSGTAASSDSSGLRLAAPAPAPASASPPAPPRKKKEFRSVSEEAADIIRRHREMLEASAEAGT